MPRDYFAGTVVSLNNHTGRARLHQPDPQGKTDISFALDRYVAFKRAVYGGGLIADFKGASRPTLKVGDALRFTFSDDGECIGWGYEHAYAAALREKAFIAIADGR